jgi:hypothetical protein
MADDCDERFRQHAEMPPGLARMLAAQQVMNEHPVTINERLTAGIERLDITQARVETL